uniref:DUF659 domain-containing protein n=1 Tax=Arundo donax TaxID=35708 RepID=A0A0A9DGF4_ARUDO
MICCLSRTSCRANILVAASFPVLAVFFISATSFFSCNVTIVTSPNQTVQFAQLKPVNFHEMSVPFLQAEKMGIFSLKKNQEMAWTNNKCTLTSHAWYDKSWRHLINFFVNRDETLFLKSTDASHMSHDVTTLVGFT